MSDMLSREQFVMRANFIGFHNEDWAEQVKSHDTALREQLEAEHNIHREDISIYGTKIAYAWDRVDNLKKALDRVYHMVLAQTMSLDVSEEVRALWKEELSLMQIALAKDGE